MYSESLLLIYDNCDPRHINEVVTGTENGCTCMNLSEKHRTERGCPMKETRLKSQKKSTSEEGTVSIVFDSSGIVRQKQNKKDTKREKASQETTTLRLLSSIVLTRESDRTGMRSIKLLHDTSASLCRGISRTRILQLCLTLPTPLITFVTFSCSHSSRNVLLGDHSTPNHRSDQPFSRVFHIYPRSSSNGHFCSGCEDLEGVMQQTESTFKSCDRGKSFAVRWRHLTARISCKKGSTLL